MLVHLLVGVLRNNVVEDAHGDVLSVELELIIGLLARLAAALRILFLLGHILLIVYLVERRPVLVLLLIVQLLLVWEQAHEVDFVLLLSL